MFRLLPLLVLTVGVVAARHSSNHDNASHKRPIITASQRERICADLCRSGLGGEPCGAVCFDLMPTGIPLQLSNNTKEVKSVNTRSEVCSVLCENRLGYPLCQCPPPPPLDKKQEKKFRVDFNKICEHYCEEQKWALRGCPDCPDAAARQDGLLALYKQDGAGPNKMAIPGTSYQAAATRQVDWGKWCNSQCANSNGGSACNCDILPFSLN